MFDWLQRRRRRGATSGLQGRTIGKYRILEPLGRGGMARVYRAYHPQLDRYVAVKVLRADLLDDEASDAGSWRARFQREARAVAALRHPNVVRVYDFDVEGNLSYIVMECLEGDSLKTRLNDYRVRGERMGLGEVVRILLDVLNGLAYAHCEGMVHRDLKPANVLLTRRGDAVLSDFGIAQIVGGTRHTVPGALMGTVSYMAPEQGREGRSDRRSDVYSIGVIFYEMLVQRPPFEADTPLAVLMKHLNDPLPLPREIDPLIPEPFERVILKALAKDPDHRYQSAAEMARGLREAAQQAEVELPDRISLPLSFTTPEAPSDSVAVFSGAEREGMGAVDFADDDTQAAPGEPSASEFAGDFEHRPLLSDAPWPILMAAGVPLAVNIVAFAAAALVGWEQVFSIAWPAELLLVAGSLSLVMAIVEAIRMLAPVGIVAGNAPIFLYCTLTGNWRHWIFLWVFDLWLMVGMVWLTVWLKRHSERCRQLSRVLGQLLSLLFFGLAVGIFAFSMIAVVATSLSP
ncbi:MAG: protein kinase domain-containing protein [Chloroflexota bacterium]